MGNTTSNTEQQILASAEKLFLQKGFSATSTTDIARNAGCNQALVHYYFRTKENLFNRIFDAKFDSVMDFIDSSMKDDSDIFGNIRNAVGAYFRYLSENAYTPQFIFNELMQNPVRRRHIREAFLTSRRSSQVFARIQAMVEKAAEAGTIRKIDPLDLIFDGMSLVVFSFITAPAFVDLMGRDSSSLNNFLEHRKEEIITLLTQGLRPASSDTGSPQHESGTERQI